RVQLLRAGDALSPAERKKILRREKGLREAHQAEWVGDWAALAPSTGPEGRGQLDFPGPKPFRFIRGVLSEATIDGLTLECARAFVAAPQTRMVTRLFVGGHSHEGVRELQRWPYFANLRVFQYGWTSDEVYGDFCHFQCHLNGEKVFNFVKKMPRLEELYVFASDTSADRIFALKTLANLRVMQIYDTH